MCQLKLKEEGTTLLLDRKGNKVHEQIRPNGRKIGKGMRTDRDVMKESTAGLETFAAIWHTGSFDSEQP